MPNARWDKLAPDKRTSLQDAVLEEVATRGFRSASISAAIRAAGFSKGALYYYFLDKQDVLATVFAEFTDRLTQARIAAILESDSPEAFWDAVRDCHLTTWSWLEGQPLLRRIGRWAVSETSSPSGLPTGLDGFPRRVAALTRTVLQHGQRVGAVRTDLSDDLLLETTVSILYTVDSSMLRQEPMDPHLGAQTLMDLLQRLVRP